MDRHIVLLLLTVLLHGCKFKESGSCDFVPTPVARLAGSVNLPECVGTTMHEMQRPYRAIVVRREGNLFTPTEQGVDSVVDFVADMKRDGGDDVRLWVFADGECRYGAIAGLLSACAASGVPVALAVKPPSRGDTSHVFMGELARSERHMELGAVRASVRILRVRIAAEKISLDNTAVDVRELGRLLARAAAESEHAVIVVRITGGECQIRDLVPVLITAHGSSGRVFFVVDS